MRASSLIQTTLILLGLLNSAPVFAQALSCEGNFESKLDAIDLLDVHDLTFNANLRRQAQQDVKKIDDLDAKIAKLRSLNGTWETAENAEKRTNMMMFETFLMLDDTNLLKTHFGAAFASTGRAAVRVLSSEAILKTLAEKKKRGASPELEKLIEQEEVSLELAKEEFLGYANITSSLQYVLDVMKDTGEIVDPSSMFGGKLKPKDIHGNDIKADVAPVLEAVAFALPQVDLKAEEVKDRAAGIDSMFAQYFDQQPIQELISYTRKIVGQDFVVNRLTSKDIAGLRSRLQPDWKSTSEIMRRRQAVLRQERLLRWKLRLMGPQFIEAATTWFDSLSGKRKAMLAPVAKLVGLKYDDAVKRRHLPMILKIISMTDPKEQLVALEENSNATPYAREGELIVTFIRFVRGQETWKQIKATLAKSDSDLDKLKLEKFNAYEKEAVDRGPLNLMSIPTDPVGTGLATAVTVATGTTTLGGSAIWASDKLWLEAQHLYASENIQALLHWAHLAAGAHH